MIPLIVCYYFFLLFVIRHLCLYLYYCLFHVYPYSLSITLFFLYPSHPFLHSYLQIYIYMHALMSCTILVPILSYYIISYYILSCYIISYHVISYPIMLYHILLYPILLYPIICYPILSYPILSYPILSYLVPNTSSNLVLPQSFRVTSMP